MWLVLDIHPAWSNGVKQVLYDYVNRVRARAWLHEAWSDACMAPPGQVAIAWTNTLPTSLHWIENNTCMYIYYEVSMRMEALHGLGWRV